MLVLVSGLVAGRPGGGSLHVWLELTANEALLLCQLWWAFCGLVLLFEPCPWIGQLASISPLPPHYALPAANCSFFTSACRACTPITPVPAPQPDCPPSQPPTHLTHPPHPPLFRLQGLLQRKLKKVNEGEHDVYI